MDQSVGTSSIKNTFGISTIIRTPKKDQFVANLGQNSQRTAVKPKINYAGFNINTIQDKKTFKFN